MENPLVNKSRLKMGLAYLAVFVLIILIIINMFELFYNFNLIAYLKGFVPKTALVDEVSKHSTIKKAATFSELGLKKQVFNIPGNHYSYENAKALCSAYGAQLATLNQIETSYKSGAEWCNYGWSEDQMALFPTQEKTYKKLQSIQGHEHDCGRPGVNGGFIANKQTPFGVNCYGDKPRISKEEQELMNTTPYPETLKDKSLQKRVDYWKGKLDQVFVSPFNYDTWGSI